MGGVDACRTDSRARALFGICALVSAVVTGLVLTERISLTFLIAWIVVQSIVATIVAARVETVLSRIDSAEHALGLMAVLLGRIEREQFASARLVESQRVLATEGIPPSRRIAQLRRLVAFVDDASRNLLLRPARRAPAVARSGGGVDRPVACQERSGDYRVAAGGRGDRSIGRAGDLRLRAPGRSFSETDRHGSFSSTPPAWAIRSSTKGRAFAMTFVSGRRIRAR